MEDNKIETFTELQGCTLNSLIQKETSAFNGMVRVVKYKVAITKIEEPKEVYQERLQKLWDECDNHHHWTPLRSKAKELGVELIGEVGTKRKQV